MFPSNMKPVVKWAGGKSKVINQISKYIPTNFNNYHEPFVGGGALFFYLFETIKLNRKKAYLSDFVDELINLYLVIKSDVENLIYISDRHVYDKKYYYDTRAQDPIRLTELQRASRFLYLNKTCFNGLYRVNQKGQFNVSFGDYKNPVIVDEKTLKSANEAFRCAEIFAGDFELVLNNAQEKDFIYLDPPYVPLSTTSNFTSYTANRFGAKDQARLKNVFAELSSRGCYVMLSNSNVDLVKEMYFGNNIKTITSQRAINSDITKRGIVKELLILSYSDNEIGPSVRAL